MPPFMTAQWRNLVMLNFAADPDVLAPYVPRGTVLDDRDGEHFVSIIGFQFLNTSMHGIPVFFHRHFDEVNLRLYVRRVVGDEVRRGVVFIKEIVSRRAVAAVANRVYHETYVRVPMRSIVQTPGRVQYDWRHGGRWHGVGATVSGEPTAPTPGSLEEFIAEHYWGYTKRRDGITAEFRVEHPPWKVWHAKDAWLDLGEFYDRGFAPILKRPPVSAFVADGSPVRVFPIRHLTWNEINAQDFGQSVSVSSAHAEAMGRL